MLPGSPAYTQQDTAETAYDFNRDVKPLLTRRCLLCHGPDESSREAGLRLDIQAGATMDLGGYAAGVAGQPENSELVRRIESTDESEMMPPADHGDPLTDRERRILRAWIKDGARYEQHWSYQPPTLPELPAVSDPDWKSWPSNPVDRFTLRRMLAEGLTPEKPADRLTLARRLALDLTGLPPTLDQADRFAKDSSPQAYERYVDALLESSGYGEHWAAMWLDLARYADSAGYAEDKPRTIWAYRDYVIRSYANNQPFDEFTLEQIAGDLLPKPGESSRIATAFHRNTLTNSEGGTDDEEFRTAAVVDRTNTTLAVWMGTTMGCAQCHTHKYDPITQEEYFQVYAILNSTADNDHPSERPVMSIFDDAKQRRRKQLETQRSQLMARLAAFDALAAKARERRVREARLAWEADLTPPVASEVTGQVVRIEIPGPQKILQLAEVQIFQNESNLALDGQASLSSTYPGGDAKRAADDNTDGSFSSGSVAHSQTQADPWWQIDLGRPQAIDRLVIWNRTDNQLHQRLNGAIVKILDSNQQVVWERAIPEATREAMTLEVAPFPEAIRRLLATPQTERSHDQQVQLDEYFESHHSERHQWREEAEQLQAQLDSIRPTTTVPVLEELTQPRETRIQIRGSHANLGDPVQPGTPAAFHAMNTATPSRLDLARWLVDRQNPLTARVAVNRYWQRLFGTGLVRTSEDFGAQGDLPSHPELLDYLAVQYMESGWDNRALLKLIVMSATYQQSSRATTKKRDADPDNRWLARGPRFRVTAEMVRDQALFAAGLLSEKQFGPPVRPPAPELGLKAAFSGAITWKTSTGEDRYRRAIYTQWRRSSPYPSMETFDVSNREVCDLRRISTNTPLQALVTLNDEVYIEAARALARAMQQTEGDLSAKVTHGFRRILIRPPTEPETRELIRLYQESLAHFQQHPDAAQQFADPSAPATPTAGATQLAAWTTVGNVLLNLDEVLMKR